MYYLHQILPTGEHWTSEPISGDRRAAAQAVLAGFLMGQPRWAVDEGGALLYGVDGRGISIPSAPALIQVVAAATAKGRAS